ncbi:MAG: 23S rRNA (uracil(1939)-C(5))-methyltransferase RlmD [Bacteroidota bacterium]|nr:23S rRNA (uracil(1939)-C(5))-methyltransferase RlmD [Bacteroidota bacterium]MDP4232002.1 23S rRNA (uracil(1939)-C(5))-methyltransferase RlmD [Bacteroidota bacterium]MDP4241291.1 23S rRNA (uracil(1939)-C(5))-methyltransferase RlmD [Bacteroidota bacterium]MDP4286683.1 23S rRNA (uracil(1939)-C(5))-methyltransferase RlmD [Bacteroidota bacterium]
MKRPTNLRNSAVQSADTEIFMADTAPKQPAERLPKPERGARLELRTESLAFEGKAVARRPEDGYVVFIEGALGQERVVAEILKAKGNFAEAKLIDILEPSADRRAPICPYFGTCGGCALQHMTYPAQRSAKREQVRDLFRKIGKIDEPPVREAIAAESEFYYRNKMEFSFSDERWLSDEEIASGDVVDRFALGLHVRNRFDRVIDTEVCFLPKTVAVDVMNFTRQFAREHRIGVFDPDFGTSKEESLAGSTPDSAILIPSFLRFLVVKTSYSTGEVMVNLVTSRDDASIMETYTRELLAAAPSVTTVVNNVNMRRAQVAVGDFEKVYHGSGSITDRIGRATFRISANSFFQANTAQAERLYAVAAEFADLHADDTLWDLYCGTGTISLFVADRVKSVLGIELVQSAIADAESNAQANGIANVQFVASDLRKALTTPEFLSDHPRPSVMIIDPPRSGMHPDVIREILRLQPERIAYVSCNPATQARDVQLLAEGYDLLDLQPVDMFPQTFHIECVAKLRRNS